jgi:uncharacterized protein (TIGR00251 family)
MPIEAVGSDCRIRLWIQPRASRNEIVGIQGDAIKVRLTAPPVEGQANQALLRFLSKRLEVTRDAVMLSSGAGSRRKTVQVTGLAPGQVRSRLGLD